MPQKIKLLDEKTINKIAAGEVIDRPASIIKELVENSIDANSSSISIEIKKGGKEYIRVTDNGDGILKEDLEIAFLRHSTSKISSIEDLQNTKTLGFRGEALASIAAVSKVEGITKTKNEKSGNQIIINGGKVVDIVEIGCPNGTTIIIRDLFYNIPVRRKFLKSDATETAYISDNVYRLALSNPNISFKYLKDNKVIVKTPGNGNVLDTIYSLYGKDIMKSLISINNTFKDISLKGFISNLTLTKGNRNYEFIFVNGRFIRDIELSKIIEDAYKSLITINRFPVFFLYIDIPPDKIDVNIHPTKTEIRFEDKKLISNFIKESINMELKKHNLIPEISIDKNQHKPETIENNFLDIIDNNDKFNNSNIKENIVFEHNLKHDMPYSEQNSNVNYMKKIIHNDVVNSNYKVNNVLKHNNNSKKFLPSLRYIGRLFETYILAEDIDNNTFYIIDQHAAHERVMYEKIRRNYEQEKIVSQNLLVPEVINLTHGEIEIVKENKKIFNSLGFEFEEFGVNAIILRSVPMVFGNPNSRKLFIDILDNISKDIKNNYDLNIDRIMKISCRCAIKAGDNLKKLEVEKLLNDLRLCIDPYTCPHGRPIVIKMTRYELEKKFKRIQ